MMSSILLDCFVSAIRKVTTTPTNVPYPVVISYNVSQTGLSSVSGVTEAHLVGNHVWVIGAIKARIRRRPRGSGKCLPAM